MAYEHRRVVRFDDADFARLVYYPRLFVYCHNAFEDFFRDEVGVPYARMLQHRGVGFPVVNASADFRAPLRFGDPVRTVMETLRVGRRSLTNRYRLFHDERQQLCAELRIVTASISMERIVSVDLPEDVRQAFLRHLADASDKPE
jgi:YbgC/YbaW family acyl-CoA thioester hydrolase